MRPLLFNESGQIILSFSRRPLVGSATSPRSSEIPRTTAAQAEALNVIQKIAENHALTLELEPGEMLFWNNMGLLHCRNGFTDTADSKRHLVRLWIHDEESAWQVPEELSKAWEEAYDHAGRNQLWPLDPIVDRHYVSTQQRSSGHS
jgi:Taurine catabolism dioxygenase TauD, TfdA family